MAALQKIISLRTALLSRSQGKGLPPRTAPEGVREDGFFPLGYSVFGFHAGPQGGKQIMVGAGNPATSEGALFLGTGEEPWTKVDLPDETAWVHSFLRLPDGTYLAGGMTALGRGALLCGSADAKVWSHVELDLHPFAAISELVMLPNGDILAATGAMITQGKTKPVLFRSADGGKSWTKEEVSLPITMFRNFTHLENGVLIGGTAGDHTPLMYQSPDFGRTWNPLPEFPAYKTYKIIAVREVPTEQGKRLLVIMWGYKTALADRVVRFYELSTDAKSWTELPPLEDSHFVFSFCLTRGGTVYMGSEKGKVFRSDDGARTFECVTRFPTNIGAYAIFEDEAGRIWIGNDFVEPDHYSLWRVL